MLGLAQRYLKSSRRAYELCSIVEILSSTLLFWLHNALLVVLKATKLPQAVNIHVRWPTIGKQKASAALLEVNIKLGALLKDLFGITDCSRFKY